jgi:hypothetical protein
MADDGLILALAVALDVALTRGAKRHIWVRVINGILGVLFLALLAAVIYVTFKYS